MSDQTVVPAPESPASEPAQEVQSAAAEATAVATPEAAAPAESQTPDYDNLLNQIPPDVLRRHPKFNGVLGSELQRRIQAQQEAEARRQQQEAERRAEYERLQRLKELDDEELGQARRRELEEQEVRLFLTNAENEGVRKGAAEAYAAVQQTMLSLVPTDVRQQFIHRMANQELVSDPIRNPVELAQAVLAYNDQTSTRSKAEELAKQMFLDEKRKAEQSDAHQNELAKAAARQGTPRPDIPGGAPGKRSVWDMSSEEFDTYFNNLKNQGYAKRR